MMHSVLSTNLFSSNFDYEKKNTIFDFLVYWWKSNEYFVLWAHFWWVWVETNPWISYANANFTNQKFNILNIFHGSKMQLTKIPIWIKKLTNGALLNLNITLKWLYANWNTIEIGMIFFHSISLLSVALHISKYTFGINVPK